MKVSGSALWVIITSAKLTVMAGAIIAPVVTLMRDDLGVGPASAGLVITMHALSAALCYPFFESFVTKTIKPFFVGGLFLYGVAGGSGLFIMSYQLLLLSRVFLGIGLAAVLTSFNAMMRVYTQEERKTLMGLQGSSTAFGSINWPVVGGFLGVFSWHLPFAVYALTVPLGFLALITVPNVRKESEESTQSTKSPIQERNGNLVSIYGLTFLTNMFFFTILVFVPQLLEKVGISFPFLISFYIITIMISSTFSYPLYEKIRKISYEMTVPISLGLWSIGFALMSANSGLIIAGSVVLFGIGEGLITAATAERVNAFTYPHHRISMNQRIFGYLGQFLAPIIFFPAVISGLNHVFLSAAVICTVLFLLLLFNMRK
jgi:ACDE family multidrug resistance protein